MQRVGDDYTLRPTRIEEGIGALYTRVSNWVKQGPVAFAKENPLQSLMIAGALVLAPLSLFGSAAMQGMGGELLGVALVPARWIAVGSQKAAQALLGSRLPDMGTLPTLGELANNLLVRRLAPKLMQTPPMGELLKDPLLASIAPRLAGLRNLSMPQMLRLLPSAVRNSFLRQWLGITDEEVGRVGLEQAILNHLVTEPNQVASIDALLKSSNFSQLAPKLTEVSQEQLRAILAETPRLRAELAMGLLSIREKRVLLNQVGHHLELRPNRVEEAALRQLCPKLGRTKRLDQLLTMEDLKTKAPRLYGLDPTDWSWSQARLLLSPEERLADFPTWDLLKANHYGLISLFLIAESADTSLHGDPVQAGIYLKGVPTL
jgi:hypothetical protein